MADFEWKEFHLEWFLEKFKDDVREISAREIEKKYRPRKGKPIGNEQTIDSQDFRNLMRLMVMNEYARVTRGCFSDNGYKIRMVSDGYPYTQELFDSEIFSNQFMCEILPEPTVLMKIYLPSLKVWSEIHQAAWVKSVNVGVLYVDAFHMYNYLGGDFDNIFLSIPDEGLDEKRLFTLEVMHYIALYKAFKIGISELIADCRANSKYRLPDDHNSFFISVFRSFIIKNFLLVLETKDVKFSHRYMSDIFNPILKTYAAGQRIPLDLFTPIDKIFKPSDELFYRYGAASRWLEVLGKSDNPDVQKAVREVKTAFLDIAHYHLTRYNRSRLK
jgi:hypothetical protein